MTPLLIVAAYLVAVVYIGIFAFRHQVARGAEDFFLADRSLGPFVFLLSLFGTNMTAFSILGSSGHAFSNGIVVYGLMASIRARHPAVALFIGTRIWAIGQRLRLHDPGADLPRSLGVRAHRHRDLRGPGGDARALHHHRRHGRRRDARGRQRRPGALLGSAARRRAGGHELCLLRRDARYRLGQHTPDADVPRLRNAGAGGGGRRHGRLRSGHARDAARSRRRRRSSPASASRRGSSSATRSSRCRRSPFRTSASSA